MGIVTSKPKQNAFRNPVQGEKKQGPGQAAVNVVIAKKPEARPGSEPVAKGVGLRQRRSETPPPPPLVDAEVPARRADLLAAGSPPVQEQTYRSPSVPASTLSSSVTSGSVADSKSSPIPHASAHTSAAAADGAFITSEEAGERIAAKTEAWVAGGLTSDGVDSLVTEIEDVVELGKLKPADLKDIGRVLIGGLFKRLQPITLVEFRDRISPLVQAIFLKPAIRLTPVQSGALAGGLRAGFARSGFADPVFTKHLEALARSNLLDDERVLATACGFFSASVAIGEPFRPVALTGRAATSRERSNAEAERLLTLGKRLATNTLGVYAEKKMPVAQARKLATLAFDIPGVRQHQPPAVHRRVAEQLKNPEERTYWTQVFQAKADDKR